MPTYKKKGDFFESEAGLHARNTLLEMESSNDYTTTSSYTANTDLHPDNTRTFTEKHMEYLRRHPNTDPDQYLSNLKLITRLRER